MATVGIVARRLGLCVEVRGRHHSDVVDNRDNGVHGRDGGEPRVTGFDPSGEEQDLGDEAGKQHLVCRVAAAAG